MFLLEQIYLVLMFPDCGGTWRTPQTPGEHETQPQNQTHNLLLSVEVKCVFEPT